MAVVDDSGKILVSERITAPTTYDLTIQSISNLVHQTERKLKCRCLVGLSIPGKVCTRTGFVVNARQTSIYQRSFPEDIQVRLKRIVRIQNDANCFTLSEALSSRNNEVNVVFGAMLGTGVGGGVVVNGDLLNGCNQIAGEWGHSSLPWPSHKDRPEPRCRCGRRGCIQAYLSGPAFAYDHQIRTGEILEPKEIVACARNGQVSAKLSLDLYAERLAKALSNVINILDPHLIVLGGGLSNINELYETVPTLWGKYVHSSYIKTAFLAPAHGDYSAARGAALLWKTHDLHKFKREKL